MSEPLKVSTSKYLKDGKVEIDGHVWTAKLPGAGKELEISKVDRRIKLLNKKVEAGEAEEEDLDKLDQYEDRFYEFFTGMFRDDTPDNSEVKAWIDATPFAVILAVFKDITDAADNKNLPSEQ